MSDLRERLDSLVSRRDKAAQDAAQVQGRLVAAKKAVHEVEAEIRERGVEPSKLSSTITAVEAKLEGLVTDLESRIAHTEKAIAPFLDNTDGDDFL